MARGDVRIAILGDSKDFQRAVRDAVQASEQLERKVSGVGGADLQILAGKNVDAFGRKLSGVAEGAALAAAAAVGAFAFDGIQQFNDLQESLNKTNVLFDDSAASVVEFSQTAATALGQTQNEALAAASTFGNLFNAIGLSTDAAAEQSIALTKLASDLASFDNTSPADAVEALGAALRGESEPIRRYGVLLDDATLKQRALSMGLIESTTGTLPPAIRAQAAYAEILAQTSKAQGDFARTRDGAANQQRILRAQVAELQTQVGEGLAPALADAVRGANELAAALNGLTAPIGGVGPTIQRLSRFGAAVATFGLSEALRLDDAVRESWADTTEAFDAGADSTDRMVEATKRRNAETTEAVALSAEMAEADKVAAAAMATWAKRASDSSVAMTDATRDLARAQQDLERVRRGGVAEVQARAELTLRNALLASADASERASDAQRRLDRQRREAASGLTRNRALLDAADAQERLLEAQSLGGRGDPYDALRATVGVQEATLDIEDANSALAELDAGVNRTLDSAGREAESALVAVEQASLGVLDARRAMSDAVQDYARAVEDAAQRELKALAEVQAAGEARAKLLNEQAVSAQGRLYGATLPGPGASYAGPGVGSGMSGAGVAGAAVGGATNARAAMSAEDVFGTPMPGSVVNNITITIDGSNMTPEQLAAEIDRKGSFMAGGTRRF